MKVPTKLEIMAIYQRFFTRFQFRDSCLSTIVQGHENGYPLDKKVDTTIPSIVIGQENG
ncbi:hypothetical protein [Bacillus cereus]|uniref:hypothetical protein n=1 Tax=Bacillus cereus TaxID=1396 RepID=UPI0039804858